MSYLSTYATRNPRVSGTPACDEKIRLNLPGFHGGAHVPGLRRGHDRSASGDGDRRSRGPPADRGLLERDLTLVRAELGAGARENSLHKIDTLIGALQRFRAALDAEAELRIASSTVARRSAR